MTDESRILRLLDRGYSLIWREGRLEEALGGLDDDFEWLATDVLDGAVYKGPDEVIGFFRDWIDSWEGLEVDWDLHELDAERGLAVIHMRGTSRASGIPAEMHFGQIWEMSEGRFTRMTMYTDVAQARRAAGLA
jgi:ketosteroid isomerase-like protein